MSLSPQERRDASRLWQSVSAEANAAAIDVKREDMPLIVSLQHYASIQEKMTEIIGKLSRDEVS